MTRTRALAAMRVLRAGAVAGGAGHANSAVGGVRCCGARAERERSNVSTVIMCRRSMGTGDGHRAALAYVVARGGATARSSARAEAGLARRSGERPSDGCGAAWNVAEKPYATGPLPFCPAEGTAEGRLGLHPPGHPAPGPPTGAARGRLWAGRGWTGRRGACGGWEGLAGVPVAPPRPGAVGPLGPSLRPAGAALPAAPGRLSVSLPAPRRAVGATPRGLRGCRYGWIKGCR